MTCRNVDFQSSIMAAKAYVVSMTVSELKDELKQRGLSTKGSKKDLRDRLEQALYDEELEDPESEEESDGVHGYTIGMGSLVHSGFNFEVPPESFIAEEDILPDDDDAEPMIVSVQLSDRDRLEVYPRGNASAYMGVGVGDRIIGDGSLSPMIVAVELGNSSSPHDSKGADTERFTGIPERQMTRTLDPLLMSDPRKDVVKDTVCYQELASSVIETVVHTTSGINGKKASEAILKAEAVPTTAKRHTDHTKQMTTHDNVRSVDLNSVPKTGSQLIPVCESAKKKYPAEPSSLPQAKHPLTKHTSPPSPHTQPPPVTETVERMTPPSKIPPSPDSNKSNRAPSENVHVTSSNELEPEIPQSQMKTPPIDTLEGVLSAVSPTDHQPEQRHHEGEDRQAVGTSNITEDGGLSVYKEAEVTDRPSVVETESQSSSLTEQLPTIDATSDVATSNEVQSADVNTEGVASMEADQSDAMTEQTSTQCLDQTAANVNSPEEHMDTIEHGTEEQPKIIPAESLPGKSDQNKQSKRPVADGPPQPQINDKICSQTQVFEIVPSEGTSQNDDEYPDPQTSHTQSRDEQPSVETKMNVDPEQPPKEPVCVRTDHTEAINDKTEEPMEAVNVETEESAEAVNAETEEPMEAVNVEIEEPVEAVNAETEEPMEAVNVKTEEPMEAVNVETKEPVSVKTEPHVEAVNVETEEPVEPLVAVNVETEEPVCAKTGEPVEAANIETEEPLNAETVEATNVETDEQPVAGISIDLEEQSVKAVNDEMVSEDVGEVRVFGERKEDFVDKKITVEVEEEAVSEKPEEPSTLTTEEAVPEVPTEEDTEAGNDEPEVPTEKYTEAGNDEPEVPTEEDTEAGNDEPEVPTEEDTEAGNDEPEVPTEEDTEAGNDEPEVPTEKDTEAGNDEPEVPTEEDTEAGNDEPEKPTKETTEAGKDESEEPTKDTEAVNDEPEEPTEEIKKAGNDESEERTMDDMVTRNEETEEPTEEAMDTEAANDESEEPTREVMEAANDESEEPTREVMEAANDESEEPTREVMEAANDESEEPTREVMEAANDESEEPTREVMEAANDESEEPTREVMEAANDESEEPTREVMEAANDESEEPTREVMEAANDESEEPTREVMEAANDESEEPTKEVMEAANDESEEPIEGGTSPNNHIVTTLINTTDRPRQREQPSPLELVDSTSPVRSPECITTTDVEVSVVQVSLDGGGSKPEVCTDNNNTGLDEGVSKVGSEITDQCSEKTQRETSEVKDNLVNEELIQPTQQDPSQVEVEFLVHAAEDDLNVFSNEAAEADQALTSSSKHRRPSTTTRDRSQRSSRAERKSSTSGGEKRRRDQPSQAEPTPVKRRRISTNVTSTSSSQVQDRKRRWGSGRQRSNSGPTAAPAISSDVIQDIIPPEVSQLVDLSQVDDEAITGDLVNPGVLSGTCDPDDPKVEKEPSTQSTDEAIKDEKEDERTQQELETRRRIESRLKAKLEAEKKAKEESMKRRTPSPPRHPPTRILHVENLTRPFTKAELYELLCEDGPVMEEAFWTDKIRSHCIAVYDSKDVAMTTRRRIHGIKWPSTNPKYLVADFLSPSDVARISKGQFVIQEEEDSVISENNAAVAPSPPLSPDTHTITEGHVTGDQVDDHTPMETEVENKPVEEKATRVLDELFRKTKATPSIYWLPLSETQVEERAAIEREREAEREKRREERIQARRAEQQLEGKERERRVRAEREQRARERMIRRSRSRSRDRGRR